MVKHTGTGRRRLAVAVLGVALASHLTVGVAPLARAIEVPPAPTNVRGVTTSGDGEWVSVAWEAPDTSLSGPVLGYRIQASSDGGATWQQVGGPDDCEVGQVGCEARTDYRTYYTLDRYVTYVFEVAARGEAGWGPWSAPSAPFTVNPGGRTQPGVPRDLTVSQSGTALIVTWRAPAPDAFLPPSSYDVDWRRVGGTWVGPESTRDRRFVIRDLRRGDSYIVRVRSVRSADSGEVGPWVASAPVRVLRSQAIAGGFTPPHHLAAQGRTVLAPCSLRTNAGQRVRVGVAWRPAALRAMGAVRITGSVEPVIVRRAACGRVVVVLNGMPGTVAVKWEAPATATYEALKIRRVNRIG